MSKQSRGNAEWLRHQAQARQTARAQLLARQSDKDVAQQQAKAVLQQLISQTMLQQQRLARLAPAFADRCWRVHELLGLYRGEWERAQGLQRENEVLRGRVAELEFIDGRGFIDDDVTAVHDVNTGGAESGLSGVCQSGAVGSGEPPFFR